MNIENEELKTATQTLASKDAEILDLRVSMQKMKNELQDMELKLHVDKQASTMVATELQKEQILLEMESKKRRTQLEQYSLAGQGSLRQATAQQAKVHDLEGNPATMDSRMRELLRIVSGKEEEIHSGAEI